MRDNYWFADNYLLIISSCDGKKERGNKASGVSFTGSRLRSHDLVIPQRSTSSCCHTEVSAAMCQLGKHAEAQFMALTSTHEVIVLILILILKLQLQVLPQPLKISPFLAPVPAWQSNLISRHGQPLTFI